MLEKQSERSSADKNGIRLGAWEDRGRGDWVRGRRHAMTVFRNRVGAIVGEARGIINHNVQPGESDKVIPHL